MNCYWEAPSRLLVLESTDIPIRTKPRPRVTKWGTHMPREYQAWKQQIRHALDHQIQERFSGKFTLYGKEPVAVWMIVAATRGDADNAAGGLMDALTGVAWDDDRQVMELHIWKVPRKDLGGLHWKVKVSGLGTTK